MYKGKSFIYNESSLMHNAPITTSLCPPKYLVTECITISSTQIYWVLQNTVMQMCCQQPICNCAFANALHALMSTICMVDWLVFQPK